MQCTSWFQHGRTLAGEERCVGENGAFHVTLILGHREKYPGKIPEAKSLRTSLGFLAEMSSDILQFLLI